jgi:hypothetical protein
MATAPAWAGKRCTTSEDVVIPIFGKDRVIARGMANAVLRFVIEVCTKHPKIAKLIYRVETYNCRKTTGGSSWSAHSWPIAIDVNPSENPYQSERFWRANGMKTQFREIAPVARKHGLGWGGDWGANGGATDPMHFTAATNEGGKVKPETYDPKLAEAARKAWNKAISGSAAKPAAVPPPAPKKPGTSAPLWQKGWKVFKHPPVMRGDNIRVWQQRMRDRGWAIIADGAYGPRSATVARAFQREHRLVVDGIVGPATWRAAWERPVT